EAVYDEFVVPFVVKGCEDKEGTGIKNDDDVILYNFRPDRAAQHSEVYTNEDFMVFEMERNYSVLKLVTFTKYSDDVIADIVFEKKDIVNTIGEVVGDAGGKQLRIAETEKYPHV